MSLVAVRIKAGRAFSVYALEENGTCQLLHFLHTVEEIEVARLQRLLDYLKEYGAIRNLEQSKPIGDGKFELRTRGGLRVFYFYDSGKIVVCTNGYLKKKQKLDPDELKRCEILRRKYLTAKEQNTLEYRDDEI